MMKTAPIYFLLFITLLLACNGQEAEMKAVKVISITVDGNNIASDTIEVGLRPQMTITFDGSISKEHFENAIKIDHSGQAPDFNVSYTNSNSKVTFDFILEANMTYSLIIEAGNIGEDGQLLEEPIHLQLTTNEESLAACTSASSPCLRQFEVVVEGKVYQLSYFSNYPLKADLNLENIDQAVFLIHGANRNNDDYFNWMNQTLEALSISKNTLLVSPQFKAESETSNNTELNWNNNDWREGSNSENVLAISSFAILDSIIARTAKFIPSINKILVTGHSSGGLFTHLYGAANQIENQLIAVEFEYMVANSQYFYYPTAERVNESTSGFYIPENCAGYDFWPLGYKVVPSYLSNINEASYKGQFISRNIHYLLGNGNQSDPSLNTSDCGPVLLGSSRYQRGENMFFYLQSKFPENNHSRTIVNGIGHNGEAMYKSEEFRNYLQNFLLN